MTLRARAASSTTEGRSRPSTARTSISAPNSAASARGDARGIVAAGGTFDVERDPGGVERVGKTLGLADDGVRAGVGAEQGHDAFGAGPRAGDAAAAHPGLDVAVDMGGGAAEGDFAEGEQVAFLEEAVECALGGVGAVDAAVDQPLAQLGGGDVDQLDLVGEFEHVIGQGFGGADAGDAGNVVVEAFQVLDVERGPDGLAGLQQLGDILPALGVAAAGGVGVGEFVDQQQAGVGGQRGVEVELLEDLAAVFYLAAGQQLEVGDLRLGFGAAMGFDHAGQYIVELGGAAAGLVEHFPGLADARGRAEEDLQAASGAVGRQVGKQRIGIGAAILCHGRIKTRLVQCV